MFQLDQLKTSAQSAFVVHEDDGNVICKKENSLELFPNRSGFGWSTLSFLLTTLFYFYHFVVAIIFITFFVSTIAFGITVALDIVSEMISPTAGTTTSKKDLLSVCLFVLLFAVLIVACFILSLFWEVLKVILLRSSLQYHILRVLFVCFAIIVSGLWVGIARAQSNQVSLAEFFEYMTIITWLFAFVFFLFGSLLLLMLVFTHTAKNRKIFVFYAVIVIVLVAFAVICPIAFGVVANQTSAGTLSFVFFFPLLAAALLIYSYFRGKTKDRKVFIFKKCVCLVFLVLFVFSICMSLFINTPATCKRTCRSEARTYAEAVDRQTFSSNRFQICSKTWTSINLTIADLAFLANLTYNKALENGISAALQTLADDFFQQKFNWTVQNNLSPSSWYFHLKYNDVHVIGIRGPVTNTEFAETARLWDEIAVLQSIGFVVPILNYFPETFISEYVDKISFVNKLFSGWHSMFLIEEIESTLKNLKNTDDVVLVGHSFGGGIAKIIGARLQIPAISFSSPGIAHEHLKLGFTLEDASKFVVSISPQKDFVALIDKHAGLEQQITCDGKTFAQCHLIERTYCVLHNVCGLGSAGCQAVLDN